jgi:hypothetical protein
LSNSPPIIDHTIKSARWGRPDAHGFTELGAVDLVELYLPFHANSNQLYAMVNGAGGLLIGAAENLNQQGPRPVSATHFPESHRVLPNGTQAFVFRSLVSDGCRACPVVADLLVTHYFQDGLPVGRAEVLVERRLGEDGPFWDDPNPDRLAKDIFLVQRALAARGYDPGSFDGKIGPRTRAAIDAFQGEACLVPTGELEPATLAALAARPERAGQLTQAPLDCPS